jgi:Flp pilus assembly protein TadG
MRLLSLTRVSGSRFSTASKGLAPRRLLSLRSERGTALVEFTLILPLLLILLFGIFDFGKAINYWIDEGHLASQGVRLAAVDSCPGTAGSNCLQNYIKSQSETPEMQSGGGISLSSAIQVCITFPTNSSTGTSGQIGDPVKVQINGTYNWMSFVAGKTGVTSSTISASSVQRLEQLPTSTLVAAGCA